MAFPKITQEDLVNKGVTGLPDVPNLSVSDMQHKFDELGREVIPPKHNALVDALEAKTASADLGATVDDDYSFLLTSESLEEDADTKVQALINVILKECQALDIPVSSLSTIFTGITAVVDTISDDDEKIPTAGAIVDYVQQMGGGDMTKAVYDANDDGIADVALDELTDAQITSPSDGDVPVWNGSKWVNRENIGKKLSAQTLTVGSTTLTFTDAKITTSSTIEIYADKYGVAPTDVTVTTGQADLTFDAQTDAISVYLIVR
jgi:hypothetical protein